MVRALGARGQLQRGFIRCGNNKNVLISNLKQKSPDEIPGIFEFCKQFYTSVFAFSSMSTAPVTLYGAEPPLILFIVKTALKH